MNRQISQPTQDRRRRQLPGFRDAPARDDDRLALTRFYGVDSHKSKLGEKPPLWDAIVKRFDEIPGRGPGIARGPVQQTRGDSAESVIHDCIPVT